MCDAIMERRLREELAQSRGLVAMRENQLAEATGDVVHFVDLWHNACEERDAARDLAVRLEGMLGSVENFHDGRHYCRGFEEGEWQSWLYRGDATDRCPTYRLAHGTGQ